MGRAHDMVTITRSSRTAQLAWQPLVRLGFIVVHSAIHDAESLIYNDFVGGNKLVHLQRHHTNTRYKDDGNGQGQSGGVGLEADSR
jgi:hypothetical protein